MHVRTLFTLTLLAGTASFALADDHAAPHAAPHPAPHAAPTAPAAPRSLAKPEPRPAAKPAAQPAAPKAKPAPREADDHAAPADNHAADPHAADTAPAAPPAPAPSLADTSDTPPDAATVLKWLREGNQRWVAGKPIDPNNELSRRARLAASGQKPLATIVSCADSRVPADRIFDRGVGELFVVRVAGNVAGDSETGTVEYGVGHLKTPLLIVMGHTKCGAVAAAASGAQLHGKVAQLVAGIVPSVDRARRNNPELAGDDLVAAAVRENVWQTVYDLFKKSPELADLARRGEVNVIGAVCDISSGEVEFLGNHPWQAELIDALAAGRAAEPAQAAAPDHE